MKSDQHLNRLGSNEVVCGLDADGGFPRPHRPCAGLRLQRDVESLYMLTKFQRHFPAFVIHYRAKDCHQREHVDERINLRPSRLNDLRRTRMINIENPEQNVS